MSVKKSFDKTKNKCKITFVASKEVAGNAETVNLVGDFNSWNCTANPMTKMKDGSFKLELELDMNTVYEYKFLLNGTLWVNDDAAEKYINSPYIDSQNAVVFCYPTKCSK